MPIGNRVYLKRSLPDPVLCRKLKTLPASNVADQMERSCAMNPRIRLMSSPKAPGACGPALTVKTRAGDNLLIHQAINMAQEGDVLVISNEGDNTRALIGELMLTYAFAVKKIAAIVVDGPIRDFNTVRGIDAFVYATGTTPGGPYKEGPGEINVPVSCGEVSVSPGDLILADMDGAIVIPRQDALKAWERGLELHQNEEIKMQKTLDGSIDRSWVEKLLEKKNCELIDKVYGDE